MANLIVIILNIKLYLCYFYLLGSNGTAKQMTYKNRLKIYLQVWFSRSMVDDYHTK